MVDYIDQHKESFGVAPICDVLQVAPSTYYAAKARPPSPRRLRDETMSVVMYAIWQANYSVYGARKLCKAMQRAGHAIGRDQVARLMRHNGLRGVRRGAQVFTKRPDNTAVRAPDLVKRDFSATGPNRLRVTDLTYVATWSGMVYVCFITDVFSRMIVGWTVASNMRTQMVLDTLEHARYNRGTTLESLICHSDAGRPVPFDCVRQRPQELRARWLDGPCRRVRRQRCDGIVLCVAAKERARSTTLANPRGTARGHRHLDRTDLPPPSWPTPSRQAHPDRI